MSRVRALIYAAWFYPWTALHCIGLLWALPMPKPIFLAAIRYYLRSLSLMERLVLGITYRVEGEEQLPTGPFIVAPKHQSMWETMKLHLLFRDPAIILKRELLRIPLWGWYATKADLIPVDRGGRSRAIESIVAGARRMAAQGRPIVIYPQGTRAPPGAWMPYKVGVFAIYEALKAPVVPLALNSGIFWSKFNAVRAGGTITLRYLEPIPPGLDRTTFMATLESRLETESDRLVQSLGGPPTQKPAGARRLPPATLPTQAESLQSTSAGVQSPSEL